MAKDSSGSVWQWQKIAEAKRASRDNAIPAEWRLRPGQVPDDQLHVMHVPAECGILTSRELHITVTDAAVLVEKLINREYTSYEVHYQMKQNVE
jgi:amidase